MSVSNKIKYFKKIAILLTVFWTVLTIAFFLYQLDNEKKHIQTTSVVKIKNLVNEASSLIYWAYRQKAKEMERDDIKNFKTEFSIREMLDNISKSNHIRIDINLYYNKDDLDDLDIPNIKNSIIKMQKNAKETYDIFTQNGKETVFYTKPLIANELCIKCHFHNDVKKGSVIGSVSAMMNLASFKDSNWQSFKFFLFLYSFTWLLGSIFIWWIYYRGKNYLKEKLRAYEESVYTLVEMMEKRDAYTAGHGRRVATYSKLIAQKMGFSDEQLEIIYKAGILHDIGKIEIPDALLLKPDRLDDLEYALIKRHSKTGYDLLCKEPFKNLATIVLYHHERFDGKGYPAGLKGDKIPLSSQIISVADAFDAMTTNRAYKRSMSVQKAVEILIEEKGKQFNPKIVDIAKDILLSQTPPEDITQLPADIYEEMKFSYYFRDQLTGFYNMSYIKFLLAHRYSYNLLCIYHINCRNFSQYNKEFGWKQGDELLKKLANTIADIYKEAIIVRVVSDHFLVIHTKKHVEMKCTELKRLLDISSLEIECRHFDFYKDDNITPEKFEKLFTKF